MSISYSLELTSPASEMAIAQEVNAIWTDVSEGNPCFQLMVDSPGSLEVEVIESELGLRPDVSVQFRWDKFSDPIRARCQLIRACVALLGVTDADAALLLNGEVVILTRRGGELTLNRLDDFWVDEVLEHVPKPYVFRELAQI